MHRLSELRRSFFQSRRGGCNSDDIREADSSDVAICARLLNHTIGELARSYGTASVVATLTEVMGCASCVTASEERGTSIRALVERLDVTR